MQEELLTSIIICFHYSSLLCMFASFSSSWWNSTHCPELDKTTTLDSSFLLLFSKRYGFSGRSNQATHTLSYFSRHHHPLTGLSSCSEMMHSIVCKNLPFFARLFERFSNTVLACSNLLTNAELNAINARALKEEVFRLRPNSKKG